MTSVRTISCSDEVGEGLWPRNQAIKRGNLALLSDWLEQEPVISCARPRSGTSALLHYRLPVPLCDFCGELLKETGVMFTPGSAPGLESCIQIGSGDRTRCKKYSVRCGGEPPRLLLAGSRRLRSGWFEPLTTHHSHFS